MIGLASLLALAIGLSVIFSIWRISGNVRAIREHFDRIDAAAAMRLPGRRWVEGTGWVNDPPSVKEALQGGAP